MKAFHFRLDQALRWRTTQMDLEKSRVSLAAQLVRQIHTEIEHCRADLSSGSADLSAGTIGASLVLWAAFTDRSHRRIRELENQAITAGKVLTAQMHQLVEANRRLQLLSNLKQRAQAEWHEEFNRELEAFAGESYLFRLQSRNARARSSGG